VKYYPGILLRIKKNTGNIKTGNAPAKILNQYLHPVVSSHWVDVTALMMA
jgi:hypothetical protein